MAIRKIYTRNTDSDSWVQRFEADDPAVLADLDGIMADMAVHLAITGEPQVEVRDGLGVRKFTIKQV